jgi:ribosomal protein S18 acetylase RimI-like enzyme
MIRPLAGAEEVDAYVALHQSAFESKNMTREWRQRTLQHRDYQPGLDLVAVAPDGRLAAFCVCWFTPNGYTGRAEGQVEPLGVGPAFRKLGLGKAVLAEGLRRLREREAEWIYVETDNFRGPALRLYESAGFRVQEDVLIYRKAYAPHST